MDNRAPDRIIFFDGNDIAVLGSLSFQSDYLVINFSSRINSGEPVLMPATELYPNEIEGFFYKRQIPTIYFFARRNDWWQTEEMFEAIRILDTLQLEKKYKYVITYGLSMGAYGALMFSRLLKANRVIAIAPQYSVNSKVVPFETRWPEDRERISFIYDDMAKGLTQEGEVIVFYDRFFEFDKGHADLIAQHRPIEKFLVNFATHTVARTLNDMGIFTDIMERLFSNRLTKKEFFDLVRSARYASPLLLHNMSQAVKRQGRDALARELVVRAVDVMEQRLQQEADYYHKVERAMACIRTLENYLKNLIAEKKLSMDCFQRADYLASHFILASHYAGWHLSRAAAAIELGLLTELEESLDYAASRVKGLEVTRFLALYARFALLKPDPVAAFALKQQFGATIQDSEAACLYMGNIFLAAGCHEDALAYFKTVVGDQPRAAFNLTHRQALIGIAKASGLEDALQCYDNLLIDHTAYPDYKKVRNTIIRQAR